MSCGNSRSSKCNPCGPSEAALNEIANKAAYYARIAQYASDEFNKIYLGAKDVAPTTDNDGLALQEGALYFNTVSNILFVWDGSSWLSIYDDEIYLGGFAVAPTLNNQGLPLQSGNLYWNTGSNNLWAYNGTTWIRTNFNETTPFLSTGSTTARTLANRFADVVNVKDFGAVGDGSGALVGSAAIGASWNVWPSWINGSNYGTKPGHDYGDAAWLAANLPFLPTDTLDFVGIQLAIWAAQTKGGGSVQLDGNEYIVSRSIRFVMPSTGIGVDLVGTHRQNCIIKPLVSLAPINSIGSNIGSGVLYFYRIGLSGCSVNNIGITTLPKNGGIPTIEFDSTVVTQNWISNGTYHSCILLNNCDTVDISNVFMSGYGEAGIVSFDNSPGININNVITEYQTCAILLIDNSVAYINNSILFSSSGTGISSWGTSAICLNESKAYITSGQISLMRNWAVYSTGAGNEFTIDGTSIYTDNYGLFFNCKGLFRWRIANCFMTYGVPNLTPIVLLDHQNTGSDSLNPNSTGLFIGNNVANAGGLSNLDIMRVNGTYIQITNNNFNAQANGSLTSNLVINSLFNGNYFGQGTVKCLLSENIFKFFNMSNVSVFGTKQNNIDTIGNSILVGTAYPGSITINSSTTSNFNVTVTGVVLGDIVTGVSFYLNQLTGLTVSANVVSNNTVSVQLANLTGSNITISNELWTVLVQRINCL
jgi:hypothetical protein